MDPIIRVSRLCKKFGRQTALDEASFDVPRGVVFALLGENGAGKSTTIRILLGLAEADSGQAQVLGLDSSRDGLEIRRQVGYVPERPTLYEWMTVDEIGWFAAGFYPPGFLTRYREQAGQFKLPLQQKIKNLSKGMRSKVALALAMAHDPELLVLDEPTSGLDTLVRREFLESMVDRAGVGKTVLLSSHQIHEVERIADYVAVMRDGKLLLVERLERLKARIQELTITLEDGGAAPPAIPGEVLRERKRTRQWQLVVSDITDEEIAALRSRVAVQSVEVRTLSLEEIFVALMQSKRTELSPEICQSVQSTTG